MSGSNFNLSSSLGSTSSLDPNPCLVARLHQLQAVFGDQGDFLVGVHLEGDLALLVVLKDRHGLAVVSFEAGILTNKNVKVLIDVKVNVRARVY